MAEISRRTLLVGAAGTCMALGATAVRAQSAQTIDARVDRAIQLLLATEPRARNLYDTAKGVLIIPEIVKGGLFFGGAYGEGALRVDGRTVSYYSFAAGSFGLQAGLQTFKLALFFMTEAALERFQVEDGWAMGADAELTFPGDGLSASVDSTSQRMPVVAMVFGQDGFMAGASIAGAKYSRINR
jgi:lipid-binding SYLF domain-containing protein